MAAAGACARRHRAATPDAAGCVRALVAIEAEAEAGVAPGLPSVGDPALPAAVWRWLEVESGVPAIEAATAEHFVPQMVNFEQVGGVDFRKGCYPGQEVVARSQYRGTIKRGMVPLRRGQPAAPGDEVFAGDDPSQPAGEVVNAAPRPDASGRYAALVELRIAAAGSAVCRLRGVDGPVLARRELPYRLPGTDDAVA